MNDFFKKYKIAIIVLLIAVIVFGAYYYFFSEKPEESLVVSRPPVGQELFATLSRIENLSLDTSVLNNQIFSRLTDFSLSIVRETSGRNNPFAPISPQTVGPRLAPTSQITNTATVDLEVPVDVEDAE